jgi:hypothetical protein
MRSRPHGSDAELVTSGCRRHEQRDQSERRQRGRYAETKDPSNSTGALDIGHHSSVSFLKT